MYALYFYLQSYTFIFQGLTLRSHLRVPLQGPTVGSHLRVLAQGFALGSHLTVLGPGFHFSGMLFSQACSRATVSMKQEKYCFESSGKISWRSKRNKSICFWVFCKKSQKLFHNLQEPLLESFCCKVAAWNSL